MDDRQGAILAGAYAAAVNDDLLAGWGRSTIAAFGGTSGLLATVDRSTQRLAREIPLLDNVRGYEEYLDGMWAADPQIPHSAVAGRSVVYTDADHVDLSDPITRDYCRWQKDRFGAWRHVTLVARLPQGSNVALSIHVADEAMETAAHIKAAIAPIFPQLCAAFRLGAEHAHALVESYWLGLDAALDMKALLLIDEKGRVMRLNAAAQTLLRERSGLTLRQDRLGCRNSRDSAQMQSLIATAIGATPVGGAMRLDDGELPLLAIRVTPIVKAARFMVAAEPAGLVLIESLLPGIPPPGETRWRGLFGLTAAEAALAPYLALGLFDREAAAQLGVKETTVRTHTRALLEKTGVRSKAELAHILTLLS